MKQPELLVKNVILDPTYKPAKLSLNGAMLRPVIAGRALPPRGVRILTKSELTVSVVADLARGMEHGALAVRHRFGPQKDLTLDEIRLVAGLPVESPPPVETSQGSPLASVEVSPEPVSLPDPPAEIVIPEEPVVEEVAPEPAPVEEVQAPVEEEPAPIATPEDLLASEPASEEPTVYTADELLALKSDQLSELLVSKFDYPADQLYKLKTKQAKVDEILSLFD